MPVLVRVPVLVPVLQMVPEGLTAMQPILTQSQRVERMRRCPQMPRSRYCSNSRS